MIRNAVEQTSRPTDLLNEACLHHDHDGCCHHDHEDCGCHEHHHDHEGHGHEHHHDHEDCGCHEHHHHDHEGHHHADDVFTSWGTQTVEKYDRSEIEQFLDSLADEETYGTILRAKGIVEELTEAMEFDYARRI